MLRFRQESRSRTVCASPVGYAEGLPVGAKVRSAGVIERVGIEPVLGRLVVGGGTLRLSDRRPDADHDGEGKDRIQSAPGPRGGPMTSGSVRMGFEGPRAAAVAEFHRAAEAVVSQRTLAWTRQNRRMSKDHERLPENSEAFFCVPAGHVTTGGYPTLGPFRAVLGYR